MTTQPTQKSPFVERLPCKLTVHEKDQAADSLAHSVNERDALTLEKALAAQRYAKEIKACDRKIGDLAEAVRTGVEYRQVPVKERPSFERNVIEVIRLDTNEVCGQRVMRADERQTAMFPKAASSNGNGSDAQTTLTEQYGALSEPLGPDEPIPYDVVHGGPGDDENDDDSDDDTDEVVDDDEAEAAISSH
jgi:hypothetical protein